MKLEDNQESINSILKSCPIVLDSNDNDVIELGLYYLPYSTGFEIECSPKEIYIKGNYELLGLHYPYELTSSEQRFRVQNGISGLNLKY